VDRAAPASGPLFVHRRMVVFGDTDAAGIVYTGRFPQFGMEAIEAWLRDRLETDFFRLVSEGRFGCPCVHLTFDLKSPLLPPGPLDTTVRLARVGRSSLHLALAGHEGERLVYTSRFVFSFVENVGGAMRSTAIPERFRSAIERELALAHQPAG